MDEEQNQTEKKEFSENVLDELITMNNLEEEYILIENISEEQTKQFLTHFKEKKKEEIESKIGRIIGAVRNREEMLIEIKKEMIGHFKERHRDIATKISFARKRGKDVEIDWIRLMSIPLKIKMFDATKNKADFFRVKNILDSIEKNVDAITPKE